MIPVVLSETELKLVLVAVDNTHIADHQEGLRSLRGKLIALMGEMLKRKQRLQQELVTNPRLAGYKIYAVELEGFGIAFGDYRLGRDVEEAIAGAEEELAACSYGDFNAPRSEEVPAP